MAKVNPIRFSTKYGDDESDLLYYGYRYYKASTGTWLSRDPVDDLSFARILQQAVNRGMFHAKYQRRSPVYVLTLNDPANGIDRFGLDVYKVTSSTLLGIPLHRQIVGDDGNGGCYILEFFGKRMGCHISCFGFTIFGPGNVAVARAKGSAADYIASQGDKIVEVVDTSDVWFWNGQSVDYNLSKDVDNYFVNGTYIFLWHDCGTIANAWISHSEEVLREAEDSFPY